MRLLRIGDWKACELDPASQSTFKKRSALGDVCGKDNFRMVRNVRCDKRYLKVEI